jgi:hypothetical protein
VGSRSKARARAKANQVRRKGSAQAQVSPVRQARPGSQPRAETGTAARLQAGSSAAAAPSAQHGTSREAGPRARSGLRDQPAQASATAQQGPPPRTVLIAAAVQAVEAVGVLAASVLAGIDTGSGRSYHLASGIAITIIGVCTAGALGLVAYGLRSGRRWSRTPAVLTQLFVGIVAVYLLQSGRFDWGVPFIVLAVAGLATILAPPSVRLLTPGKPEKAPKATTGNIAKSR